MKRRNFLKSATGGAALAAVPLCAASAQPNSTSLVGTWKLARVTVTTADGSARPLPYGPKGLGLITLTADGRMMAILNDGRRTLPDGAERAFVSYCGNYTFDGTDLVTRVDSTASLLSRMGSDQKRRVSFEGDLLVLSHHPTAADGVVEYRKAYWQKISDISA
ncbi:MAG TPA: lipocalin-like domain-containing protein [Rhizomicrobium sp.]|nr:lipocalin-like domain-containing protein [Rhizomicrobium sp.]